MKKIKIMTFNIGGCEENNGIKSWEKRSDLVIKIIKKYAPDLIGFQEVQNGNLVTLNKFMSDYAFYLGPRTNAPEEDRGMYNPIYWKLDKFKKITGNGFYISPTPNQWSFGWDSMFVRGVTWVELQFIEDDCAFTLINTHLDNKGELSRTEGSNLIIQKFTSSRSENNLPMIITGDFNSRAWMPINENRLNYPHPVVAQALPSAEASYQVFIDNGFKDTYLESGHSNSLDMNTYHDYYGENFPAVALRLDWILISSGKQEVRTENFTIIRDAQPPIYPSDHYPVLTELTYFETS